MSLTCTHCGSPIADASVDRARQIATCGSCGALVDVKVQMQAQAPRMRSVAELPAGMEMKRWWDGERTDSDGDGLEITRRWLRGKHFVLLTLASLTAAGIGWAWANDFEPQVAVIIATIIVSVFIIRLVPMFVNTTKIRVSKDRVVVTHGPVPTLMFRDQTVAASNLNQLFARKFGVLYEVCAKLDSGEQLTLVRPLVSQEQALFVEQAIEKYLGITDFEVDGELEVSGSPAAVSSGTGGGAVILVPIFLAFAVFMMFSSLSTDLEGSFVLSGEVGNTTFTPTACDSGQLHGFSGAQLTSENAPGLVVRAIKDPVRGTLIAVEHPGQQPIVLTPDSCERLTVSVSQTGTVVNEVYAVRGSADAKCPGFEGVVTFDGCY